MALWGDKDSKTANGTITIDEDGVVSGTNTLFTTQAKVGNYIIVDGTHYLITSITSNTACTVRTGVSGAELTPITNTTAYNLTEKPAYVTASESDGDYEYGIHGDPAAVYGISAGEAGVAANKNKGVAHAGWVRHTAYQTDGINRYKSEVLVAMSSISGDLSDIDIDVDPVISFNSTYTVDFAQNDPFVFTCNASVTSESPLSYQWQVSEDEGDTWTNILGATTQTLTIDSESEYYDFDNIFQCVVSSNGAANATDGEFIPQLD